MGLIKKLRKAKKEAPPNEKPAVVKTHLRDMIIVPEMVGSIIGIYNGKVRVHGCLLWNYTFLGYGVPSSEVIRFKLSDDEIGKPVISNIPWLQSGFVTDLTLPFSRP